MNFIRLLSGDAEITRYIDSDKDHVLWSEQLRSEGFHAQRRSSFAPHIFNYGKTGAVLSAKAPVSGDYYIALQVRDTFGTYDEEYIPVEPESCGPFCECMVELSVNGKVIGDFRYGRDDKKYYFFVTEESVTLKENDEISYRVVSGECVLFTVIALLKEKPERQLNAIKNLTTDNGEVRFWTKLACRARILLGENVYEEKEYLNNHRFTVPQELWGVRFIIELQDEEGNILCGRGRCLEKVQEKKESSPVCIKLNNSNKSDSTRPAVGVLPIERGKLYQNSELCVFDEEGSLYPAQCKTTSKWDDGSLRTVSLEAILPMNKECFYVKNDKACFEVKGNFSAVRDEDGVTVINGDTSYRFSDGSDYILPDKEVVAALYDENGARYIATGGTYEIEEQGINHIVITRINRFMCGRKRGLKCLCHIHFYRNISAYRLEFGFENDLMNSEFYILSGMYLEGKCADLQKTDVLQLDERTAVTDGYEREMQHDGRFTLDDAPLIIEDFWQNYPKAMNTADGELKIGICPFITKPEHYRDEDILLESRLFFYLKTGKYELHGGLRKYHSLIFGDDAVKLADIPYLNPEPAAVEKSAAFGHIKCSCEDFPKYDEYMDNSIKLYLNHRESYREYGMLNYGDSFGEGNIHWMNLEYDFHYGLMMHYLRTGDYRFYDIAKAGMAHYAEVDTCHKSVRFEEDGYFFVHTVGHANNYYPHELVPKSYPKIKFQMGHLFTHGLAAYYKMTGIERYKETVTACADSLAKYYTAKFDFLTEREPGWCMLALEAAYEITLDEYYLNACRIMAERVLFKQDKNTGCIKYMMPHPRPKDDPERTFCFGGKPFMHGVLGAAMKNLYYLTGDERIRECAALIAKWLAEEMYDSELKEFWYSTAFKEFNRRVSQPETSMEILDAVLFGMTEGSGDYLDIVKEAFDKMLESPYRFENDVAKVFAMRLRFSPEIMYDYEKAKKLSVNA